LLHELRAAVEAGKISRQQARKKLEAFRQDRAEKNRRGAEGELRRRNGRPGPSDAERQLDDLRRQLDDVRRKYDELIDRLRSMREERVGR